MVLRKEHSTDHGISQLGVSCVPVEKKIVLPGESLVEDTEEVSSHGGNKNAEEEAAVQWEKKGCNLQ